MNKTEKRYEVLHLTVKFSEVQPLLSRAIFHKLPLLICERKFYACAHVKITCGNPLLIENTSILTIYIANWRSKGSLLNLVKVLSFSQLLSRGRPQNLSTSHDLTNMSIGPVGDPAETNHIRLCRYPGKLTI